MDVPETLPLNGFLISSASLLEEIGQESRMLQQHLGDQLGDACADRSGQLDPITLQSLDQLTQTVDELAVAFLAVARNSSGGELKNCKVVLQELRLQRVRDALIFGSPPTRTRGKVEIF